MKSTTAVRVLSIVEATLAEVKAMGPAPTLELAKYRWYLFACQFERTDGEQCSAKGKYNVDVPVYDPKTKRRYLEPHLACWRHREPYWSAKKAAPIFPISKS